MIPLAHYLILSALLFCIGLAGVLRRGNLLVVFMSLELMLNAANIALVAAGRFHQQLDGQVLALLVLTVAAAEVAVGLALFVALYRLRGTTRVEDLTTLKL